MKTISNISKEIFSELIKIAEPWNGNCIESNFFNATYGSYTIDFGWDNHDYENITIEDFGYMSGSKWVELEPTDEQMELMKKRALEFVREVEEENERERIADIEHENEPTCKYELYGLSQSMFI